MITVNIEKAKTIAHNIRRFARLQEFAPFDSEFLIPSLQKRAETERQKIRDKYSLILKKIDSANRIETLKQIVDDLNKSSN